MFIHQFNPMKHLLYSLFTMMMLLTIVTSCKESDPVVEQEEKGTLISVSYNASSSSFILTYSSGQTETVKATLNRNTTPPSASTELEDGTYLYKADASTSGKAEISDGPPVVNTNEHKYVNDWIYEEMSIYYLWNTKIPKNPDFTQFPADFFDSILNKYNASSNPDGDRFSWIQENYTDLLKSLTGVSSDEIGFEYIFVRVTDTQYYALVLYPRKNTDAEAKGISRGRFVTKINGQNITSSNYQNLFGGTGSKTLSMADWTLDSSVGPEDEDYPSYKLTNSDDVTIQMHSNYAENPIYMDSVYTEGSQKVGYLVYNFFARDKGDNSNSYDKHLMDRLSSMQSQGITDMVLDLRYNGGGAVSSAIALSSALVKDRSTDNILVTSEYNSIVHNSMRNQYGANYNKEYFIDKIEGTSYPIPAMNLPRLYVLVKDWTASASEFVINGLSPYMDVILVGETTYGKNVGSISIYEENDPNNKWGMQPIIVRYANSLGFSDFTAGFTPDYEVDEFADLYLYPFGDSNDPMLGKALSLITGTTRSTSVKAVHTPFRSSQVERLATERMLKPYRFDMQDDIRGEEIKRVIKK